MSDEEKQKKVEEEQTTEVEEPKTETEAAVETPTNEEPKPVAEEGSEDEEESAEEKPKSDETDEADKAKTMKLVDSIMDFKPPKTREHYEGKALDELEEIHELLKATADSISLPSGSSVSAGRQAIDDAYADVERKLQTK